MPKRRPAGRPAAVREPVQVYLAAEDSALLARLAGELDLPKAEVLRRGVRSLARESGSASPMLRFIDAGSARDWPAGIAANHDAHLADAYQGKWKRR